MTTYFGGPVSKKYSLAAGTPVIIPGCDEGELTVHIPTGTTLLVQITCATADEVELNTDPNIWMDWPAGTKPGPYMDTLLGHVTALKFTSAAGGSVYVLRERR
jgi:hypothetical protein